MGVIGLQFVRGFEGHTQAQVLFLHESGHLALTDHRVVIGTRVDQVGLGVIEFDFEGNDFLHTALEHELVGDIGQSHRHYKHDIEPVSLEEVKRKEPALDDVFSCLFP